jgi:hypothetical protein
MRTRVTAPKPKIEQIRIAEIRLDGGTQSRVEIDRSYVSELAEVIDALPPVVVFCDGATTWLADGFHRVEALRAANVEKARCEVRQGSQRDAQLYGAGANASHGLRRTNADKRRAVETLLADPEWSKWSDRMIAERCAVHHQLVATVRAASGRLDDSSSSAPRKGRDGKTRRAPRGRLARPRKAKPVRFDAKAAAVRIAALIASEIEAWPRDVDAAPLAERLRIALAKIEARLGGPTKAAKRRNSIDAPVEGPKEVTA